VAVFRVNQETGVVKKRTANRRLKRFPSISGFLVVNDGVGIAEDLARAITRINTPCRKAPRRREIRHTLHAKSTELPTPTVPGKTDAPSRKPRCSFGVGGKVWATLNSWFARLRGSGNRRESPKSLNLKKS
jgi:hypothetical protein